MATFNGKAPKHGGSHFGTAKNGSSREAPASSTGAMAPRSALSGGTVSHRTAAATKSPASSTSGSRPRSTR